MSEPVTFLQQVCIKNYIYPNLVSILWYEVKVFPTHFYDNYSFIPESQNRILNLKTACVLFICYVFHLPNCCVCVFLFFVLNIFTGV